MTYLKLFFALFVTTTLLVSSAEARIPKSSLVNACIALFTSPKSEAELRYQTTEDLAWTKIREQIKPEIESFRTMNKVSKERYLSRVSQEVTSFLHSIFGTNNIGFHYNLHGGDRESYVSSGGILATRGDIASNLGAGNDFAHKVYFFQTQSVDILTVLNTANPNVFFPRMRMGSVLVLFDLNAPSIKRLESAGVIENKTNIFYDINTNSSNVLVSGNGAPIGVPAEAFLLHPTVVFTNISAKTGVSRLSWDEQNIVMMRYIAQLALDKNADNH